VRGLRHCRDVPQTQPGEHRWQPLTPFRIADYAAPSSLGASPFASADRDGSPLDGSGSARGRQPAGLACPRAQTRHPL